MELKQAVEVETVIKEDLKEESNIDTVIVSNLEGNLGLTTTTVKSKKPQKRKPVPIKPVKVHKEEPVIIINPKPRPIFATPDSYLVSVQIIFSSQYFQETIPKLFVGVLNEEWIIGKKYQALTSCSILNGCHS